MYSLLSVSDEDTEWAMNNHQHNRWLSGEVIKAPACGIKGQIWKII